MPPEIKPPTQKEIEEALKSGLAKNPDLGNALKEFEVQSEQFEASRMPIKKDTEGSAMARLVIRLSGGAIKNEKQAEYVLLFLILLCLSISFYLFFGGGSSAQQIKVDLNNMLELHPEMKRQ